MAEAVYILCALTSLICAILLLRGYWQSHMRLLLWSGLCFVLFTLNNFVLFLDLVIFPEQDLSIVRNLSNFAAVSLLVFGLIWETD